MSSDLLTYKSGHKSSNDLQLRIIKEPLLHKRNRFALCCVCCTDFVTPLSTEERAMKLICGFIRKYSNNKASSDIYLVCLRYIGGTKEFNKYQLISVAELNKLHREDCYDNCLKCCKNIQYPSPCCVPLWYGVCRYCEDYCERVVFVFVMMLSVVLLIGKDIIALIINWNYNCNSLNEESKYVTFSVYYWIMISCIGHMIYSMIFLIAMLRILRTNSMSFFTIGFVYGALWLMFVGITVIGFLLYSEMIGNLGVACKDVVLLWCVVQSLETIIGPVVVYHRVILPRDYNHWLGPLGMTFPRREDNTPSYITCSKSDSAGHTPVPWM